MPPLTWYDVLWTIEKLGGAARPAVIVDELLFEPSALSHMARRMETAGLLKTCVAKEDRRGRVLRITSKGLHARVEGGRVQVPDLERGDVFGRQRVGRERRGQNRRQNQEDRIRKNRFHPKIRTDSARACL